MKSRHPLVLGWNQGECSLIGAFLAELSRKHKIKVLGYHGLADGKYKALDMTDILPPVQASVADVEEAVQILQEYGLHAVNGMKND